MKKYVYIYNVYPWTPKPWEMKFWTPNIWAKALKMKVVGSHGMIFKYIHWCILKKKLTKLDSELHVKRIPSWIHSKPLLPKAWFNVVNMTCWKAWICFFVELRVDHVDHLSPQPGDHYLTSQTMHQGKFFKSIIHSLFDQMIFVSTSIVIFRSVSIEVKEHMKLQLKLECVCVSPCPSVCFAIHLPRESDQCSTWHLQNLSLRAKHFLGESIGKALLSLLRWFGSPKHSGDLRSLPIESMYGIFT